MLLSSNFPPIQTMTILSHKSPINFQSPLPQQADVVIIGAGIIGICTAWFLRDQGLSVVVCDKGRVAGEQSGRNWGWIRQQGRDYAELPIMMESMQIWRDLAEHLNTDIGFRQNGSLYLCEDQAQLAGYDKFLQFAKTHKLNSQALNSEQLYEKLQHTPKHWESALFTPSDARAEPTLAVPAIARACLASGISIIENCGVDEISMANQQVDGVKTEQGFIKCNRVLCCAGHWSSRLLNDIGIPLPQLSVKASVARTAPAPLLFDGNASGSGIAFRRRVDGGYTIAMTDYIEVFASLQGLKQFKVFLPLMRLAAKKLKFRIFDESAQINPFCDEAHYRRLDASRVLNPAPSVATLKRMRQKFEQKLPVFQDIAFLESWAGMIDAMPDVVPVMDSVDGTDGLFIATGFSGHGFGIGPAAGKIMANLMRDKPFGHDISRFRFSRFRDGSELELGPSI